MSKAVLIFDGIVFGVIGLLFCFDVHRFAKTIEVVLSSGRAAIDFRATYGGLDLGLGIFFLLAAFYPKFNQAGLLCATLVLCGLLLTRLAGLVTDGVDPFMLKLLGIEVLMTAANLFVFLKNRTA